MRTCVIGACSKANANKPTNLSPFRSKSCRFFFTKKKMEYCSQRLFSSDPNCVVAPPPPNTPMLNSTDIGDPLTFPPFSSTSSF